MKNMRIGIAIAMVIFLAFAVALPVLACDQQNDNGKDDHSGDPKMIEDQYRHFGHDGFDERHHCKLQPPSSFSNVTNLTIDESVINATPHWMFLATGEDEQNALLSYIRQANVSRQQRGSWTMFLEQMWMKYPVRYVKTDNTSSKIIPGSRISLSSRENATFREIERYIAEDMDSFTSDQIAPMWSFGQGSTHENIMQYSFSDSNGIPGALESIAIQGASTPDSWCDHDSNPVCQQINHGFVPPFIGLAPTNFGIWANEGRRNFTAHRYVWAFQNMGWADHFIGDLGQPYHTPNSYLIPLEEIDSPYSEIVFPNSQMIINYHFLHDQYEIWANGQWNLIYLGNTGTYSFSDPTSAGNVHGSNSWVLNYPLVYACYWHFIDYHNTDFTSNRAIVAITQDRIGESVKYSRGLVQYITGGQPPMLTVTATAGPGGYISPSGSTSVIYDGSQTFAITPNPGYELSSVTVNGVQESLSGSTFIDSNVHVDQTILATFKLKPTPTPTQPPASSSWTWSTQGWGDWQPSWSITGPQVGPNSAYGPAIESNAAEGTYGIYGTNNNLLAGSTQSSITKTFTDPSGSGWNTITFDGLMTATDVLGGRWMTISVNGNQVFGGTAQQMPPGNNVPFEIKRSFPLSSTAIVTIANGQNPAWGPFFGMHYYRVAFSRENSMMALTEDQNSPFAIPDGSIKVDNETVTGTPTIEETSTVTEIPMENVTLQNGP